MGNVVLRSWSVKISELKWVTCYAFGRCWRHQRWSFRSLVKHRGQSFTIWTTDFRTWVLWKPLWDVCMVCHSLLYFRDTLLFHFIVLSFVHLDFKKNTLHKSEDSITFLLLFSKKSETKNQQKIGFVNKWLYSLYLYLSVCLWWQSVSCL